MSYRIVTISREFGSSGSTIGKQLADKLGIKCYDREIIKQVAQQSGLGEKFIEEKGEYGNKVAIETFFATGNYYNGPSLEDSIWALQQEFITDLAQKEPCVIVGRCADFILKQRDDVLNVFIHADKKIRMQKALSETNEKILDIERFIKDKDKRRAAYVQFYTDRQWGLASNYHISLDSGKLGVEKCVSILEQLYKN